MAVGELLAELSRAPNLSGAVCADPGVRSTFDEAAVSVDVELYETALRACSRCPALELCRAWVEALPAERRPRGVVGGLVVSRSGRVRSPHSRRPYAVPLTPPLPGSSFSDDLRGRDFGA